MRAEDVSPREAAAARARIAPLVASAGDRVRGELIELGALLVCSYPAFGPMIDAHPEDLLALSRGTRQARDLRAYRRLGASAVGDLSDGARLRRGLRRWTAREKLRIAARELLAHPGHDVDVTSRELADLADACCEIALAEAQSWAETRFGTPIASNGASCAFSVIGMGKLGGRELNAGSDIDLMLFYETDDGFVVPPSPSSGTHTLHEHFTRVAQRFVATLDEATDDGVAWRVDLRLRPEGTRGPLVNALAAAERYYETWGRTWERAALVRARPVAGDPAFGERLLGALAPFVWRRAVNPGIVEEMGAMLARARAEAGLGVDDDLKIGRGGIREVEFFTQSLQLVWGGGEPRVRGANTVEALRRLRARGFVTEREERELSDAYYFLRRLEHRVQFATGQQTHSVPRDAVMVERIARSLGYEGADLLLRELYRVRSGVASRFASLGEVDSRTSEPALDRLWAALDAQDEGAIAAAAVERFGPASSPDLPRHLLALARPPHSPLGASTRDTDPAFARRLVGALADAADTDQATRLLAAFFGRFVTPGAYVRALADDPFRVSAVCSLLGASAFLGESLAAHPDMADLVFFARGLPSAELARAQVEEEVASLTPDDARDVDAFVGALRRVKRRVTFEVGLADLAGELGPREVAHALAALADAALDQACRFALRERHDIERQGKTRRRPADDGGGLTLVGMGKLGGREIGYGSDLDLFFVHEGSNDVAAERAARVAQRVMRLLETPHAEGPGYQLDARLRPSGSQGLLVVSLEGFTRYQSERAEDWERQALLKARVCAGDRELGARVIAVARKAAYERGAPDAEKLHHLRTRMQREIGHERLDRSPARYDLKVGRGGIVDVEFAAQWLQMRHGHDPRVRSTETEVALSALETCGHLDAALAEALRDGWRFLRRLEQRVRISHGTSVSLLEEGAPGLVTLARRMGMRDGPRARADHTLLERYVAVTTDVRTAYLRVLGLKSDAADPGER
jgi:[glutamine synthetase] adenylyltransferase / [glutamine synthetase]-adenylyl-L-tyrosine phosphorylase